MTECEDCGDECKRRTRCKGCGLLVCRWCKHHIHNTEVQRGFRKTVRQLKRKQATK